MRAAARPERRDPARSTTRGDSQANGVSSRLAATERSPARDRSGPIANQLRAIQAVKVTASRQQTTRVSGVETKAVNPMAHRCSAITVLASVRAAYPEGIVPGADYVALLSVLRQHLSLDDVVGVASELIVRGAHPLTGTDLKGAIVALPSQMLSAADVDRVTQFLHTETWLPFTSNP
jgi:hypothetical protein